MHLDVLWNCLVDESLVANINKLKEIRVDEAIGSGNGELGGSERCLGMKMDFIVLDVAECELSGLMPRLRGWAGVTGEEKGDVNTQALGLDLSSPKRGQFLFSLPGSEDKPEMHGLVAVM
ncbi:hypothetical protein MG293_017382 [Ovis ammon polii]|uniref:Uncharacterized protein n=1 Tax=Ovis ammon polii TaxID=230172 RepID=A0AAD4TT22_OVIAM|nr:hypothetical protein MG293_017382 [Ovis ammon polii]